MPRILIAALVLLAACAPPETQTPTRVQALVLSTNGSYVPQEVQLKTVSDIVRMEGTVAKMLGGVRIIADPQDPELQAAQRAPNPEEAYANALTKAKGRPVTASYIDHDGVLWPADFHTWNVVTAYYNLEKAYDYFHTVGNLPNADFGEPVPVYYFAEFALKDVSPDPLKDNAIFFSPTHSFMVLPFDELQRAPLAINSGIMSHEYAHLIFNQKVYGGAKLPFTIVEWGQQSSSPGANLMKALDEGLADYHGFGVTCTSATGCDPRFLRTSFDDGVTNTRDLSRSDRCMDFALRESLTLAGLSAFTGQGHEYRIGSILASALYQVAGQSPEQHKILQRAIISAYSDENPDNLGLRQLALLARADQSRFNLVSVSAVLIKHVTDLDMKTALCNELIDHLQVPANELAGVCPASAVGGTTCTRLP